MHRSIHLIISQRKQGLLRQNQHSGNGITDAGTDFRKAGFIFLHQLFAFQLCQVMGRHFGQSSQHQRRGLLCRSKKALYHGDIHVGIRLLLQRCIDRHHGANVIGGAGVFGVVFRHKIILLVISNQPNLQPLAGDGVWDQRSITIRLFCEHL